MTIQTDSIRRTLQQATGSQHTRLDARLSAWLEAGAEGYRRILLALAGALPPLEQALEAGGVTRLLPDWPQRRRTEALRADLAALGVEPPPPRRPAALAEEAEQFGALYVLEGSRLGARALLKQALRSDDAGIREATRHLRHGEGKPLWTAFLERLEASQAVRREPQRAVAAARATFALFEEAADAVA